MAEEFFVDTALVLVAAGSGTRIGGDLPKQFLHLRGEAVYLHALRPFLPFVGETVVVVPAGWEAKVQAQVNELSGHTIRVVEGGGLRQESVLRGLESLSDEPKFVLIHDAARPFVSADLVRSVAGTTRSHGACIPVLRMRDTVKQTRGDVIERTIPRDDLCFAQTPQGFSIAVLREAFERALEDGFQATDDASLVERLGIEVRVVPGSAENLKLTWPRDLKRFVESG